MRILGHVNFVGGTISTDTRYHMGIIVAPSTMDALDMDPAVDTTLDWMYFLDYGWKQDGVAGPAELTMEHVMVDLRGRRKFTEGDALFVVQNSTGANVTSFVSLNILVMNP